MGFDSFHPDVLAQIEGTLDHPGLQVDIWEKGRTPKHEQHLKWAYLDILKGLQIPAYLYTLFFMTNIASYQPWDPSVQPNTFLDTSHHPFPSHG